MGICLVKMDKGNDKGKSLINDVTAIMKSAIDEPDRLRSSHGSSSISSSSSNFNSSGSVQSKDSDF